MRYLITSNAPKPLKPFAGKEFITQGGQIKPKEISAAVEALNLPMIATLLANCEGIIQQETMYIEAERLGERDPYYYEIPTTEFPAKIIKNSTELIFQKTREILQIPKDRTCFKINKQGRRYPMGTPV